jgi:hypothetical protein
MPRPPSARSWNAVVAAVGMHPGLWATAAAQVLRLSPVGWWRRPPFLPLPDPAYVRFRIATQYGGGAGAPTGPDGGTGAGGVPAPGDVVEYLRWCRDLGAAVGSRAGRR